MTLDDNTTKLFPVKFGFSYDMFKFGLGYNMVEKLIENGFKNGFKVVYKNKIILHVLVINEDNDWKKKFMSNNAIYPHVDIWKPYTHYKNDEKLFMSIEEIKNIKRTLLIDNMLK